MPTLGNMQWVGYFHVFGAFKGYLNSLSCVTVIIYTANFLVSLYQCVLETFEPNILRVWFKLRKLLFSDVIINMSFVL